ncbi:selenocysteine-specific translation elongation factor [Sutcliffiella horikoshii]|uniref:Selenocysteine-specific elongation factor n=1 Tax=Sutcliffiella horikoshii TaxID=79883 RepID=A0A5D4T416_9BACI|nr:selenocysteine-specific translation elongation factor [Sutcliffiella horikoshii]TYS70440.1 selenocysteine-specific translation elongation factor [Sutcliffiella horikoshii]
MTDKHYTIGMAGHIDHGKTTLTKALTGVDTDRLKEEKERQISIELGYAPLKMADGSLLSIIDVPGHERFIRQMIAGVSGIDLVILVVAADEGVMPQTREHLEIVKFLQIQKGIIAITKKDKVEEEFLELVKEEIMDELEGSVFQHAPVVFIDSTKNIGIDELKATILDQVNNITVKQESGEFRLPIDQVFSIKGQGTVVRGTIMEGLIRTDDELQILPSGVPVKARQLQVHSKMVEKAMAGQRVAVNLPNISAEDINRGDVLVHSQTYEPTDVIDVSLKFIKKLQYPIKQRSIVKVHIGTAEVMGKIIFFDRNEINDSGEEVLCQLRLDEKITAKRGDKLIIRRPTPVETVGGGWVIQAKGSKYKFGQNTIQTLQKVKEGSPEERVYQVLINRKLLEMNELQKETGLSQKELDSLLEAGKLIQITDHFFSGLEDVKATLQQVLNYIHDFHKHNPLKAGVAKAEILSHFSNSIPRNLVEFALKSLQDEGKIMRHESLLFDADFNPHFPPSWKKRMEQVVSRLEEGGLSPQPYSEYGRDAGLPEKELRELQHYLIKQKRMYALDDKYLVSVKHVDNSIRELKKIYPEKLELSGVKERLGLSRKYLIPFMELLDTLQITKREDSVRYWI